MTKCEIIIGIVKDILKDMDYSAAPKIHKDGCDIRIAGLSSSIKMYLLYENLQKKLPSKRIIYYSALDLLLIRN